MNKEKSDLVVDEITGQYAESIAREIANHPRILDRAIRKNNATKLQEAYVPLLRLHWKIHAEITGLVEDSTVLQEILTISRQQINDLQILSQLNPLNVESILASLSTKSTSVKSASYSSAVSHDIQLNILEYCNLDSVIALSCTNTRLWDMLNSKDAAYIWKTLADIYFSCYPEKDTIDNMKKFKRGFLEHYDLKYTNAYFRTRPNYKKGRSYYKIGKRGLLFRKAVEGGLISAIKSQDFKINFKKNYADPLAFYMKKAKAETEGFNPHPSFLNPQLERPFIWQDFLDNSWLLKIDLSRDRPRGILYDIQCLYEKTHKQKYKEELDYIFNLAIEDSKIDLETVITQFSQGLIGPNEQLRGTEQERAQFFYIVYLAMRCYQTKVIDQLLTNSFGVNEAVVYEVARCRELIDPNSSLFPRKHLCIMNMLDMAIETHSFKMIDYLISKGVDINATAEPESTSLKLEIIKLVSGDRTDSAILQFLLERPGINPNLPNNNTTTLMPLHLAVWLEFKPSNSSIATRRQIVQLLIDHRANVNFRLQSEPFAEAYSMTPLHCARHDALAEVLIENKANVNAEYDHPGSTPLFSMICSTIRRLEKQEDPQVSMDIARLLCLSGADVNKRLPSGNTLLQMTADAALQMTGQTAKQKIKQLLTILQTTKPVQKNMEKGKSPGEIKMISSGCSWMNPFNWKTDTEIHRLEEKVKISKKTQPQNIC